MHRIEVKTSGFILTREVPATIEEYNALAPKRVNPVLEDAVDNTLYRDTFADFRERLADHIETLGFARVNHGTEDKPQWETAAKFVNRYIASRVTAGEKEADVYTSLQPTAQSLMDSSSFNVSEKERKGDGPKVGIRDTNLAKEVIKDGKADAIAAKLSELLGRPVATDEKELARAIADNRRAKEEAARAAQKAELGL